MHIILWQEQNQQAGYGAGGRKKGTETAMRKCDENVRSDSGGGKSGRVDAAEATGVTENMSETDSAKQEGEERV